MHIHAFSCCFLLTLHYQMSGRIVAIEEEDEDVELVMPSSSPPLVRGTGYNLGTRRVYAYPANDKAEEEEEEEKKEEEDYNRQ